MSLPKQGARVLIYGTVVGVNDHSNPVLQHVRVQLKDGQCVAMHPDNVHVQPAEPEAAVVPKPPEATAHFSPPETTARKGPGKLIRRK